MVFTFDFRPFTGIACPFVDVFPCKVGPKIFFTGLWSREIRHLHDAQLLLSQGETSPFLVADLPCKAGPQRQQHVFFSESQWLPSEILWWLWCLPLTPCHVVLELMYDASASWEACLFHPSLWQHCVSVIQTWHSGVKVRVWEGNR